MTGGPSTERVPGGWLEALLRRIAPPAARDAVLLPMIAEFQYELGRATTRKARVRTRWVWTTAFVRAFAYEALAATARHVRSNAWGVTEQDRAASRKLTQRTFIASVMGGALATAQLWFPSARESLAGGVGWRLLLPAALGAALPVAVPFAALVATLSFGRSARSLRLRPLLDVAAAAGIVVFAVAAWVTPRTNQAVREAALDLARARNPGIEVRSVRGDREMTLGELSHAAQRGEPSRSLAGIRVELNKKPALAVSCIALALAGAAIARRFRRRLVQWPLGIAVFLFFYVSLRVGEQAADAGRLAPALAMWGPPVVIACLAVTIDLLRRAAGARDSLAEDDPRRA